MPIDVRDWPESVRYSLFESEGQSKTATKMVSSDRSMSVYLDFKPNENIIFIIIFITWRYKAARLTT